MFASEDDVRKWLRESAAKVWWVENKRGGTFGFPDAVISHWLAPMFLELKVMDDEAIEADPAQVNTIREMNEQGLHAAFVAGRKGGSEIAVFGPGTLERLSSSQKFGGRQKYRVREKKEFDSSNPFAILNAIALNDYPL